MFDMVQWIWKRPRDEGGIVRLDGTVEMAEGEMGGRVTTRV